LRTDPSDRSSHPRIDADAAAGGLSRRALLSKAGLAAGALAVPGLLSACGGDSATSTSGGSGSGKVGGRLDMYTWEGYDLPKEAKSWLTTNDVQVKAGYLGVQDDVQAKIKSPAGAGIDVSTANQSFIAYYKELGIMSPIKEEDVPSLSKLYGPFRKGPWRNDDGTWNAVPWDWGVLGLTYVPTRIPEPKTWDVMFKPEMKGRITMFDDPHQNIQLAAVILGYNPDQLTQSQLEDVKKYLIRLKGQIKSFSPTTGDQVSLLASGEVDLVFLGWIGIAGLIKDKGAVAKTAIPQGHALGYVDAAFIPTKADNRATGLAWCEQLISGDVAAKAAVNLYGGVTNPDVVPKLTPEIRKLVPYDDIDNYVGKQIVLPNGFPRGSSTYVTDDQAVKAWAEIKAA
jgi:spermidine/putrescine transport system substrate-binding protein